jgi:hypothetical protein
VAVPCGRIAAGNEALHPLAPDGNRPFIDRDKGLIPVFWTVSVRWRAQATGYNGDPDVRTPALDRLASESVNFENAVSGHPVCCPYRASLMSGQFQLTHGVFLNGEELKPDGTTLGQAFANAGYETGYIGKWHLYGSPEGRYERRLAYIPPDHRFGFQYWKSCECTYTYNQSLYYEDDDPTPRYWPGYDAFAQIGDACRFIEQRSRSRDPMFLVLSLGPPHFPLDTAPEKHRDMYRNREIQLRPNVPADLRERAVADLRGYGAHIAAVDSAAAFHAADRGHTCVRGTVPGCSTIITLIRAGCTICTAAPGTKRFSRGWTGCSRTD